MGRGSVVVSTSATDAVAKDAAIRRIHPRPAVPATPIRIANGAARALLVASSDTWHAESSSRDLNVRGNEKVVLRPTASKCPHGGRKCQQKCPAI